MLSSGEVMSSLVFLTVTYPVVYYCFRSDAIKNKKNSLLIALAVVFAALAIKIGWDLSNDSNNYYKVLDVGRHTSALDIRKSYKQISRVLHPDKNPSPNAVAEFQKAKTAYDVLMDEKLRDIYNRFGAGSLSFDPRLDELKLISGFGVVFIFWLVIIFITTVPMGTRASRTWMAIVGVGILVLEVTFRATASELPSFFPKQMTEHELLTFCHRLYPGLMVALRCISEYFYVDVDEVSVEYLKEMETQHASMGSMLALLKNSVAGNNGTHNASNRETVARTVDSLIESIDASSAKCAQLIHTLKTSVDDPAAGYYWLIMVVMYGCAYMSSGGEEGTEKK